jgi:hypothetical protein
MYAESCMMANSNPKKNRWHEETRLIHNRWHSHWSAATGLTHYIAGQIAKEEDLRFENPCRRIDPKTGEVIGEVPPHRVRFKYQHRRY